MKRLTVFLIALFLVAASAEASYRGGYKGRGNTADTSSTDTTNFNNNLSAADTDVQKALDTLDNASISGAPTTADYLVGTTNGGLSAEIVVGTSPGGELGGTWGSPTIDDSLTVDGWTITNAPSITATTVTAGAGSVGALNLNFTNSTTNASTGTVGQMGFDTNAHATGRGAVQVNDGTANTYLLGVLTSDAPSNGQVPKWNTGGTITWEAAGSSNWTDAGTYLTPATGGDSMRVFGSGGTGYTEINVATNQPGITYNWSGNSVALILDNPEYTENKLVIDGDLDLMLGNSGGVPFVAGTHANSAVGIGFYADAILPILQTTSVALGGLSYQNNTKDIGSASYPWRRVYIGTDLVVGSDLGAKANIDGSADERQLWIQGHSTQTNDIVLIEKSDGTDILTVANTGSMKLVPVASPPGTPASGDIYVDSSPTPDELCFYDGAAWQGISSGTDANCA